MDQSATRVLKVNLNSDLIFIDVFEIITPNVSNILFIVFVADFFKIFIKIIVRNELGDVHKEKLFQTRAFTPAKLTVSDE